MIALTVAMLGALLPLGQSETPASQPAVAPAAPAARTQLLEAIPSDATIAIVADLRGECVSRDLIKTITRAMSSDEDTSDKLVAMIESIPGEVAVGIVTDPRGTGDDDVVVVMDVGKPGFKFNDWLERKLLPFLRKQGRRGEYASLRIDGDGAAVRIVDPRRDNKTFLYAAVRDRTAVFSSQARLARAASTLKDADKSFADARGIRRMLRELPRRAAIRVLFNPAPLRKAQKPPKPRSLDELLQQILQPEDLVAAGGYLQWNGRAIEAGGHAILAEECKGIAQWLDRPNSESKLLPSMLGDFPVVLRVGLSSLVALPDSLYRITDNFDETISIEYREDLAAFNKETGIDFNTAILDQVHDEFVVAVRPDFSKQPPIGWVAVAPIKTPATLETAAGKLAEHFDITFDSRTTDGVTIHSAPAPTHIAWCVAGSRLIIGDDLVTVRDVVRQQKSKTNPPSSIILESAARELGASSQMMLLTDVGLLCRQAPMLPMLAGPRFAPVLSGGYVGSSIVKQDRVVKLKLRWELGGKLSDDGTGDAGADLLINSVVTSGIESVARARRQAQTVVAAAHQRGIAQGFYIYAQEHDGHFPDSLESLVRELPDAITLNMLENPYTGEAPRTIDEIAEYAHHLYRPGLTTKSPPDEVILAERNVHSGTGSPGANFTFVDGHTEFIHAPLASRLIEMIESDEPSITLETAQASLADANAP